MLKFLLRLLWIWTLDNWPKECMLQILENTEYKRMASIMYLVVGYLELAHASRRKWFIVGDERWQQQSHHYFFCFEFWNSTITWFYNHLSRCRLKLQNNSLSNKNLKDVLVDVFFTFPSRCLKAKDWRPLDDVAVATPGSWELCFSFDRREKMGAKDVKRIDIILSPGTV